MAVDAYHYSDICAAGSGFQGRANLGITSVTGIFAHGAATDLDTDDCIKMVPIPKGATILDVIVAVKAAGLDTSTGISWTVGDVDATDDLDRYVTAQTTVGRSSAGGVARLNNPLGAGYTFAADGTIDITVGAGATTNVATGHITLTAIYTMDK